MNMKDINIEKKKETNKKYKIHNRYFLDIKL